MKTDKNIQDKVNQTLDVVESLQQVKVSPFFKDQTLQRLFYKEEEKQTFWSWFTPQLQLAALVCIVAVNVYTITQIKNSVYESSVSTFASDYGLDTSTEDTLFNL